MVAQPRSIRRACALALLPAAAPILAADPPPPMWEGVWQGTVGTLPVRACLARMGDGAGIGSYYYLAKLQAIRLEQADASRVWSEGWDSSSGPPAPRWTFAQVGGDRLAGTWSQGRRSLPFRLTRKAGGGDDPCASAAYSGSRWRPLGVTRTRGVQDGTPYLKLAFHPGPAFLDVALDGFALIGDDPATRRINAGLRAAVAGTDWRECMTGSLSARGEDGDWQASLTPTLITARWLGATLAVDSDCGGAHPNTDTTALTFDRATGAAVTLTTWLSAAALHRETDGGVEVTTVRPALRRLILARSGADDADCRAASAVEEFWDIGLDRRGLRFTPELPHVDQACVAATLVPWAALAPFLSPAGRAGRASLGR